MYRQTASYLTCISATSLLLVIIYSPAIAQERNIAHNSQQKFAVISERSDVSAQVRFFGLASKKAQFPDVTGHVSFREGGGAINIDVAIDARTLIAGDSVTQRRLRSESFFHVQKHPIVRFQGTKLTLKDENNGTVDGWLTARGVRRPVSLDITFSESQAAIRSGQSFMLEAKTVINRYDFGMDDYGLIVGKKVRITINTALQKSGE